VGSPRRRPPKPERERPLLPRDRTAEAIDGQEIDEPPGDPEIVPDDPEIEPEDHDEIFDDE
jgi:hypothetical protein